METEKKNANIKYNLSVYFNFLKKYKFLFIIILLFVFILEATYTAENFLFKSIVDKGTSFSAGTLTRINFSSALEIILFIFIAIIFTRFALRWLYIHTINRLEGNLIMDMKRKYFNHVLNLSHSFHTNHKTGSLISRLTRSGGAVERMTDTLTFNFAPLIFQSIIVILALIYFSWIPALILFITVTAFIGYSFFLQKISQQANLEANDTEDIEKANISDIFTNIDSIKYFGKEKEIEKKFERLSWSTRLAFLKNWDYFRWQDSVQNFILGVGTLFLMLFPILELLNGRLTIGTLVFIYTSYGTLVGPLFSFVYGIRGFYRSMADFDDLFEYGKIEQEVKDSRNSKELKVANGEIEFKNIWFAYGKRPIFEGLSLKVPRGKKIALVGHSGSGKSTLIKLLYRFYDVNSGGILIDGKNIRTFKQESLRSEMAIVPQEAVLFDDTIYNNVAFSNPKASKEEVRSAIKFAQLDKIIEEFPNKENTIVGERGIKLSGGEKQRVSIARAILANKKILVLDEATSSLDSETEHEIQKDLAGLMQGRTSIIIAHRLSTIMNADIIVVMRKGKIVQMGSHNKLIKEPGEYKKLWNLQRGGYIK